MTIDKVTITVGILIAATSLYAIYSELSRISGTSSVTPTDDESKKE